MLTVHVLCASHLFDRLVQLRLIQLFLFWAYDIVNIFVIQFFKSHNLIIFKVIIFLVTRNTRSCIIFKSVSYILVTSFGGYVIVTARGNNTILTITNVFTRFSGATMMVICQSFITILIDQSVFLVCPIHLAKLLLLIILLDFYLIFLKCRIVIIFIFIDRLVSRILFSYI
jgi:hypothetical protein